MNDYNGQFLTLLNNLLQLFFKPIFWVFVAVISVPAYLIFLINAGALFVLLFIMATTIARNGSLGALVGWFLITFTVFLFYNFPEIGCFIEILLQAASPKSQHIHTIQQIHDHIPKTFSGKLFMSSVHGYVGLLFGAVFACLGKKLFSAREIAFD